MVPPVALHDVTIPGVSGALSTDYSFWSGFRFFVGGKRIKPRGFPRNRLTLPGEAGPVEGRVKLGLTAHPTIVVAGKEYRTGPPTPTGLQVLALLPLAALILVQGAVGALVAFGGVATNLGIIRAERPRPATIALMLAVVVGAFLVDVGVVLATRSTFGR